MKRENLTDKEIEMLIAGKQLKELREAAGLTQDELAELIDDLPENNRSGRSGKQISYIENGSRAISAEYARLLSKVLHVTPEYLLLESPYKNEIDEKIHSENYGQFIEKFFGYIGYKIEHPNHNRYARVITSTELLKSKEYLAGLIERAEYGTPIYERTLTDSKGRKILVFSDELQEMFNEIFEYAKWKVEQKFNDPSRYATANDMKKTPE